MDNKKVPISFSCEKCNYNTCRKSQYDRHVNTHKHQKNMQNRPRAPKHILLGLKFKKSGSRIHIS